MTTLSLLQSLVVPLLGAIAGELGVSAAAAGWVLTANLLAAAVSTPVLGRLGDTRGERPVVLGILVAVAAGRLGALPTLLVGGVAGLAGFALLAVLRGAPAGVVVGSLLTQVWVTVAYAALPTLVVQAVRPGETGVANAVNSITRSVGQAAGSALTVALLAAGTDPATGLPRASAFTLVCLIGVAAALAVALVSLAAIIRGHGRPAGGPGAPSELERATARSGEWSPVSGVR